MVYAIHPIGKLIEKRMKIVWGYYSVQDYKAVSTDYGTEEDFRAIEQAHNLGMKVILDWVPNHTVG